MSVASDVSVSLRSGAIACRLAPIDATDGAKVNAGASAIGAEVRIYF